jgi:Leucine-rich repeat (LRR) protein
MQKINFTGEIEPTESTEEDVTEKCVASSSLSNVDQLNLACAASDSSKKEEVSDSLSFPRSDGSEQDKKKIVFAGQFGLFDSNEEDIVFTKDNENAALSLNREYVDENIAYTNDGTKKIRKVSTLNSSKSDILETYPRDCYSFISIHGPSTRFFWFGLMVFFFQLLFLMFLMSSILNKKWNTSNVDDNPSDTVMAKLLATGVSSLVRGSQLLAMLSYVVFADASVNDVVIAIHTFPRFNKATSKDNVGRMVLSCILRFLQGCLAIVAAIFLVFISNDVVEVILNFTALNFISRLDEIGFEHAKSGKYGPRMERETKYIENLQLPKCMYRKYKHIRHWYTILPLSIIIFAVVFMFISLQENKNDWDTQILRVQIDNVGLQKYSGCYNKSNYRRTKRKRYIFTSDSGASFGFCIEEHQWYLFEGDYSEDPCQAYEDKAVIIHSSETDTFDIVSSFRWRWLTSNGPPADLYFFEDILECNSFLSDGICDENFNNIDFEFDRGDCCASTCDHPKCGIGGLINAFGSTNISGDGYSSCKDPIMEPLTICFDRITSSRDKESWEFSEEELEWIDKDYPGNLTAYQDSEPEDSLLLLYCNDIKVLKLYINSDMEGECETMWISDESNCRMNFESVIGGSRAKVYDSAVWYVNYTLYHGDTKSTKADYSAVIHRGHSFYDDFEIFDMIPRCYFQKLFNHINNMTVYNTIYDSSSKAIDWLMNDKSSYSRCFSESFAPRYALSVLNFDAPVSNTSEYQNGLWIKNDLLCRWPNIVCFKDSKSSIMLDLFGLDVADLGLEGSIATELGMLDLIQYDASFNSLTGSIPTEIGLLVNVTEIKLRHNMLNGSIPIEIGNLPKLIELFGESNLLTGPIPSEIGMLTNMEQLVLHGNKLTGAIPSEIGFLSNIETMMFDINKLTGSIPTEIGLLSKLDECQLQDNMLNGTIPSEIGSLSLLETLLIFYNNLTGSIPSEIGLLPNLIVARLEDNGLTGSIPSEIGLMTALMNLDLSFNGLTGSIPTEVGLMTSLTQLQIYMNDITGSIPSEIGLSSNMVFMVLFGNSITSSIPSEIGFLSDMKQMILFNNGLTGSIPSEIGLLSNIGNMLLANNDLTGSIPSEIGLLNLSHLVHLDLSSNKLTGSIPTEVGLLTSLTKLKIHMNGITGSIPSEIGFLTSLVHLELSNNDLTGSIPTEVASLTSLTSLIHDELSVVRSIPTDMEGTL